MKFLRCVVGLFTVTGSFSTDGVEHYPILVAVYTLDGQLVGGDIREDRPDFE